MKTSHVLTIAKYIFWVLFIGLLIKAGALLFNFGMSISNPENAKNLYIGLDLYKLRNESMSKFINVGTLLICTTAIQIYLAYLGYKSNNFREFKTPFYKRNSDSDFKNKSYSFGLWYHFNYCRSILSALDEERIWRCFKFR